MWRALNQSKANKFLMQDIKLNNNKSNKVLITQGCNNIINTDPWLWDLQLPLPNQLLDIHLQLGGKWQI